MSNIVNKKPTDSTLSSYASGELVTANKTKRWIDELDYLVGYNLPSVCSVQFQELTTEVSMSSGTTYLSYWKSPGAKILCFEVEVQRDNRTTQYETGDSSRSCYVDITLPSGGAWLSGSLFDASVASTDRELTYPKATNGQYAIYRSYADVSNVVSSSIQTITASYTNAANSSIASKGHGFQRINITEIPRATLLETSSDVGVKEEWAKPLQQIVEVSSDGTYGIDPIIKNLDRARYQVRSQFQLASIKDSPTTPRLWKGAYGVDVDLDYRQAATGQRYVYLRPRQLYGAGNTVPYNIRLVYSTDGNLYTYYVTVQYRRIGAGTYSSATFNCPGSTTPTTIDLTINMPTHGTNGEVELFFQTVLEDDVSQEIYIHDIFITENQT